jgi:membrane protease YdiL (CAAX protease family)
MLLEVLSSSPQIQNNHFIVAHQAVNYSKTIEKTMSVAIAIFAFSTLQWGIPLAGAGACALGCASVTFFSEIFIRPSSSPTEGRWFDYKNVNFQKLKSLGIQLCIKQIAVGIIFTALGVTPFQHVAKLIATRNIRIIFLATLVAPITEEILFRGFLKERIEDVLYFTHRYVCSIKGETRDLISHLAQAVIFGAGHVTSAQTRLANTVIFAGTTLVGLVCSFIKDKYKDSLIPSISVHAMLNSSNVLRILVFGR